MSNANKSEDNTKWLISANLGTVTSADITKTISLTTKDTYVDKNIEISVTAKAPSAATLAASGTASATISSGAVGAKSGTNYPITGSATISGTATANTTTSGYATKDVTKATGSISGTANLNANIPAADAAVTGSATVKPNSMTASNGNAKIASEAVTTAPTSGYYIGAYAATKASTPITQTKTLTSAGYLGTTDEITASGSVTGGNGSQYYIPIQVGSLDVSALNVKTTSNALKDYTENTSVAIPSEGSLLIKEGYYPNTFVSLDQLLNGRDEDKQIAATGTLDSLRTGSVAWTEDGKKVSGAMANAEVKSGTLSHTLGAPTYNSTTLKFDQSCTVTGAAPTVTTAGYISSTEGTLVAATSITNENHPLNKVALKASLSSGNLTVAPTLTRTAKPTADAWVDAANGDATTTKPTTAVPYVQIDAAANTNKIKVKPQVKTAGYGDTTNYDYTEYEATVGAAAATTRYIPIKTTTASAKTAPTASATGNITLGAVTTTKPTNGYYIQAGATAGATTVANAGWISAGDTSTGAATTKYYPVNTAALTHNNTATETKATETLKSTASTVNAGTSTSGYYITIGKDSETAGSVTHAASVSEGYVPTAGLSSDATIATHANVTAKTFYFASTSLTNSVSATLSGATTGYSNPVTVAASSTVPQLELTGSGSGTTGSVLSSNGTADKKYINYYTGTYTVS